MKRFARWTWHLLSILSLLLCATVAILWYQSHHARNVVWMRTKFSPDGQVLKTDWFICDRGRLGWSKQQALPMPAADPGIELGDSNRHSMRWWSYTRQNYETRWNYRFEITNKTWPAISQRLRRVRILGFEFQYSGPISDQRSRWNRSSLTVAAPCSILTFLFGAPPLVRFYRILRRHRRRVSKHCPDCGYDTRATPEHCPECGATITA